MKKIKKIQYSPITGFSEVTDKQRWSHVLKNKTYLILNQAMSWFDARASCEAVGGYPPIIENEQENCFLRDLIRKHIVGGVSVGVHIGFERFPGQTVTRLDEAKTLSYSNFALNPSWNRCVYKLSFFSQISILSHNENQSAIKD